MYDGAHEGFGNAVGDFHVAAVVGKVAFHGVHEDVCTATAGLIGRKAHGKFRVHDGKFGAAGVAVASAFFPAVFIGDDRTVAHFASGGGNGQYDADGKTGFWLVFLFKNIPYIKIVGTAVADCLGTVYD